MRSRAASGSSARRPSARCNTADGSLDETVTVRDGDTVLVPRGYPSRPPGYELYYLNVMAAGARVGRGQRS